tara:strand:- start:443 stop:580 length:138 start_codon:yes stop_codon:yes gene_type:complete
MTNKNENNILTPFIFNIFIIREKTISNKKECNNAIKYGDVKLNEK